MFIEIEENTYINTNKIVAVELLTISSEPYGEIYQWIFHTSSTSEKSVFYSRIFDSKDDAQEWFENIKLLLHKKN